ncbi:hypothetical protein AABE68_004882 [Escherichia coli]
MSDKTTVSRGERWGINFANKLKYFNKYLQDKCEKNSIPRVAGKILFISSLGLICCVAIYFLFIPIFMLASIGYILIWYSNRGVPVIIMNPEDISANKDDGHK